MSTTRSKTLQSQIMDSTTDHDPLSTIALLATAEVQGFLEGIRLSFQPDDAEFAETIHNELYHVLLSPPQPRESPQQRFMKMALAAIPPLPLATRLARPAHHAAGARPPRPEKPKDAPTQAPEGNARSLYLPRLATNPRGSTSATKKAQSQKKLKKRDLRL
jgi:hypothetical protein